MTSKELENILKSPITKGAKGRFISIEQLEQIKTIVEAWEIVKSSINLSENREDYKNCAYLNVRNYSDKEYLTLKKALGAEDEQ